jgi:hypothetical protein
MIVDKVQRTNLLDEYPGPLSLTVPPAPYGNAQGLAKGLSSDEVKITCKSYGKNSYWINFSAIFKLWVPG